MPLNTVPCPTTHNPQATEVNGYGLKPLKLSQNKSFLLCILFYVILPQGQVADADTFLCSLATPSCPLEVAEVVPDLLYNVLAEDPRMLSEVLKFTDACQLLQP